MVKYDPKNLWDDPVPLEKRAGVLLSDQIRLYVDAVHLIEPCDQKAIRPAAYDLHVGEDYYVGEKRQSLEDDRWFTIPPNGLVYVKTKESLNIPYYMIARYSLRVHHVYRGLLIDNGLHIDPGYHGHIYVPVHNFTDQPRVLSLDEPFLSMEFCRTTEFPAWRVANASTEEDLMEHVGREELEGIEGKKLVLFNRSVADLCRAPVSPKTFWDKYAGEVHKSAMIAVEERMQEEVSSFKRISFYAALVLVVSLFAGLFPWISSRYLDTERAYRESQFQVQVLTKEIEQLKNMVGGTPLGAKSGSNANAKPGAGGVALPAGGK